MALLYRTLSMLATGELTDRVKITVRSVLEDSKKGRERGSRIGEKWEPQMTVPCDLAIHSWLIF